MTRARAAWAASIVVIGVGSACADPPRDPSSEKPVTPVASTSTSTSADDRGSPSAKITGTCGVSGAALCSSGYQCVDDPSDTCDPRENASRSCPGVCQATACGPKRSCASGFDCVDDPADACRPEKGDASCAGICVESRALIRCGGLAGRSCPDGTRCIDDVADDCNPKLNPTCPGLCVK